MLKKSGVAKTVSKESPKSRASETRFGPSRSACGPLLRRSRRIAFSFGFEGLEITGVDLREFWGSLKTGVEVTVAGQAGDKLLGVRDGFLRFFRERHLSEVTVVVVPQSVPESALGLLTSDELVIQDARFRAQEIEAAFSADYHFFVATDGCAHSLEVAGESRHFVRNWTVIRCALGESWGSSGSVQLPLGLVSVRTDETPLSFPGTRRRGGILSSLTQGLETRRSAVAQSTVHALSTLFYGMLDGSKRM